MLEQVVPNLQLIWRPKVRRRRLHERLYARAQQGLKARDLLGGLGSLPVNLPGGAHHYEDQRHRQQRLLALFSLANPLR